MKLYRLAKKQFCADLSGKGAEISGGRWNSKGVAMIYTAQSIALATAEVAVHVPLGVLPKNYEIITIHLPDEIETELIAASRLPVNWKSLPHAHNTQLLGDNFIKTAANLLLKVPSVVVSGEFNYLINPTHKDIDQLSILSIEPYEFDKRLFIR